MARQMPRPAPSRPASTGMRCVCSAVTAIATVAATLLVATPGAAATVHTLTPLRSQSEKVVFRLAGIEPKTIVAARLYRSDRLVKSLSLRRVRTAARRGYLRLKIPRAHRKGLAFAADDNGTMPAENPGGETADGRSTGAVLGASGIRTPGSGRALCGRH